MELLKKDDPRRKWRSFKRHALLLLKTFSFASATTFLWYEAWVRGYHFSEDDKDALIGAIITTLGVTYGILVAWLLSVIMEKYGKVVICVLEKDKHTFLLYRDERIPIVFHLLIASVSVPLVGMIGMIAFKHVLTGTISVFAVSFILSLIWLIADQLENPSKGGWFRERIPQDWFDEDVDDFFKLGPGHRDVAAQVHLDPRRSE
jgi:membrane protein YqaA with SNARE-associated domain